MLRDVEVDKWINEWLMYDSTDSNGKITGGRVFHPGRLQS